MSSVRQTSTIRETQTRTKSAIETVVQISCGFVIAFFIQRYALGPLFGVWVDDTDALYITLVFTAAALVRNYAVRRGFERWG